MTRPRSMPATAGRVRPAAKPVQARLTVAALGTHLTYLEMLAPTDSERPRLPNPSRLPSCVGATM